MNRRKHNGMTNLTTGCTVSGARFFRVLVLLVAASVVAWGVGYRVSLYSGQSLVHDSMPPARLLAHRACPERGAAVARLAIQPVRQQLRLVAIPIRRQAAEAGQWLRALADAVLPPSVRTALPRLRSPRPPPLARA